ncbi:ATP-binding protein [Bacteroides sp.]|uniref:ATP-binding protein n=1 Tax=Bacteroides sp. TaxID=29523 RepID=UPI003AB1B46C
MEIADLYINSTRLTNSVDMSHIRYLYDAIDWDSRMICIKGARGVGKTTLMLQRIGQSFPKSEQAIYVSLDDLWFTEHRLIDLAEYHFLHSGTHLFVDEVHRYPYDNWIQELKNIYDRYPGLHIVFTGSSLLQIDFSVADLSRRCVFYTLQGLSFREFLAFEEKGVFPAFTLEQILKEHLAVASTVVSKIAVIPLFEEYLQHGYYPFYKEAPASYQLRLQQVITTILENDLPAVEKIEYVSIKKMKRLLVILSQMVPFTPNMTKVGESIETTRQSVVRMFQILERAALLIMLYSGKNNMQQLAKPEKVYLDNTNLMYALAPSSDIGNIRETFFANQLKQNHQITFSGQGDFRIDDLYTFEVGGKNKNFEQIKDVPDSYLAIDNVEYGTGNRIPLWLFGFLY